MNSLLTILMMLFISNPFNNSTTTSSTLNEKVEIVIEGNDQMKFNLSEIKVNAGDTVVLTLKHVGKLPKAAMGHNWVLLTKGTEVGTFAGKAMRARETDYIPEGDEIIVHTALIGGGEETTVEFVVPAKGEYDFICSFPGHFSLMKGKFIVE